MASNSNETNFKTNEVMRHKAHESRVGAREKAMALRRYGMDGSEHYSLDTIIAECKSSHFSDVIWLERLKNGLANGDISPDDFFKNSETCRNLQQLADVVSGCSHETSSQILALHCVANLSPLTEKNGLQLARSMGSYLVTLLSSSCKAVAEASAVAVGNLALSGYRVAKVLVNQGFVKSLCDHMEDNSAMMYGLYHLLHTHIAEENFAIEEMDQAVQQCLKQLRRGAPIELFWLLFLLSCDPNQHETLAQESVVFCCLDICTYEIFQKSDPRPLVKVVTPIVRFLANLCGGPTASEKVCLLVIGHPDLTAILMALLGTNYTHLVRETLWWFSNMINNESVVVQEQFVELSLMDRLEYHTIQAVQKIDPYAPISTH